MLYFAIVHSHINYCIPIWGTAVKSQMKKLNVMQKKTLRIMNHLHHREHTTDYFRNWEILTVDQMVKFSLCTLAHQGLQSNNAEYQLAYQQHIYHTRFATSHNIAFMNSRTHYMYNSTIATSIRYYNSLPLSMKLIPQEKKFKALLKILIIQET